MMPLVGSGVLQATCMESDVRATAETVLGADGAVERRDYNIMYMYVEDQFNSHALMY